MHRMMRLSYSLRNLYGCYKQIPDVARGAMWGVIGAICALCRVLSPTLACQSLWVAG